MCEDRALRMRKESKARRIHQLRFRIRTGRFTDIQPTTEVNTHSPQHQQDAPMSPQTTEGLTSPFPPHLNIPEAKALAAVIECVEPGVYRYKRDAPCNLPPEVKARNEKLIEIALKTVILIRRNQQLQKKLAALQFETSTFITNVMNNPGNRSPPNQEDTDLFSDDIKMEKFD